jgi:hypothetical protein
VESQALLLEMPPANAAALCGLERKPSERELKFIPGATRREGERIDQKYQRHAKQRQIEYLLRRSPLKATEEAGKSGISICCHLFSLL